MSIPRARTPSPSEEEEEVRELHADSRRHLRLTGCTATTRIEGLRRREEVQAAHVRRHQPDTLYPWVSNLTYQNPKAVAVGATPKPRSGEGEPEHRGEE
eukprot:15108425-Heterocapsa_arctica.AAC.1